MFDSFLLAKREESTSSDDNIPTKDPGLGNRSRQSSFDAGFGKSSYEDDNEIVSLKQMAEEIRSPETRVSCVKRELWLWRRIYQYLVVQYHEETQLDVVL